MIMDGIIDIVGPQGSREVKITEFYLGYKQMDINSDELIKSIRFKIPQKNQLLKLYKMSLRKDLDISCVSTGFLLQWDENNKITKLEMAIGGVGPTVIKLKDLGIHFENTDDLQDKTKLKEILNEIEKSITPISDVRGSAEYRIRLSKNMFRRFVLDAKEVSNNENS